HAVLVNDVHAVAPQVAALPKLLGDGVGDRLVQRYARGRRDHLTGVDTEAAGLRGRRRLTVAGLAQKKRAHHHKKGRHAAFPDEHGIILLMFARKGRCPTLPSKKPLSMQVGTKRRPAVASTALAAA